MVAVPLLLLQFGAAAAAAMAPSVFLCIQVFCAMGGSATSGVTFPHLKAYLNKTNPKMAVMAHSLFSTLDKVGSCSLGSVPCTHRLSRLNKLLQDYCRGLCHISAENINRHNEG